MQLNYITIKMVRPCKRLETPVSEDQRIEYDDVTAKHRNSVAPYVLHIRNTV